MAARVPGSWWHSAFGSCLAGLLLATVGVAVLWGLPGALAVALASPVITAIYGVSRGTMFPGDDDWTFAIAVTLLLGPLVPAAWLGTRALRLSGWGRALGVALGMAVGGVLVVLLAYAFGLASMLG
jgi:hypothetical protein